MKNKAQTMNNCNRVFDVPFEIQEKIIIQDDNGLEQEKWNKKYKLFADAKCLFGKEYELAKQDYTQDTIKFIIKAGIKIDENMRVIFNNKIFDIEKIDNIGFKNELLEIRAIERGKKGYESN